MDFNFDAGQSIDKTQECWAVEHEISIPEIIAKSPPAPPPSVLTPQASAPVAPTPPPPPPASNSLHSPHIPTIQEDISLAQPPSIQAEKGADTRAASPHIPSSSLEIIPPPPPPFSFHLPYIPSYTITHTTTQTLFQHVSFTNQGLLDILKH